MKVPSLQKLTKIRDEMKVLEDAIYLAWYKLAKYHESIAATYEDFLGYLEGNYDLSTLVRMDIEQDTDPRGELKDGSIVTSDALTDMLSSYENDIEDYFDSL